MFFGTVRQSCGGDDHPSANQFLYVYRLLSVNSLIKPPKRASVVSDPVNILDKIRSPTVKHVNVPFVARIEQHLDNLIMSCEPADENVVCLPGCDHAYAQSSPMNCITYYLSGYVSHKLRKLTSCTDCITAMTGTELTSHAKLIELKTRGGLQIPSLQLSLLIFFLESCVQKYAATPHTDMYLDILNEALWHEDLPDKAIGCPIHCSALTARCIHFYIATRLHFLNKTINKNRKSRQTKHKLSKVSKLT